MIGEILKHSKHFSLPKTFFKIQKKQKFINSRSVLLKI
ncbi:hypothetical protein HPSA20_0255 [Helicobacter pylori SouthAfrica20]|uniref:Uncharacterized protein n=2 Tax=Helicobacter pylori TaxID=210 RepID=T2SCX3_HELPX|nr:hypothetical protein HPSA20_0255 [Helicobacter pylori SouthAfrica20]EQD89339.1 hypothetical protein HPSA50_1664 [Helicobacter pylori SouthAfrica50]